MAAPIGPSSSVPSLPPPSPEAPPEYPDLYGKRREMARVQILEREISFLEEELKSVDGLQPASRCCKEIADFVMANSDPLLPTNKKNRRSCRFWKWLCRMPCFNFSWICCYCCDGCSVHLKLPHCCCNCKPCNCNCSCLPSLSCALPKWRCFSCPKSHCCKESGGCRNCCALPSSCHFRSPCFSSCCSCKCSCSCSCPSCPKASTCCRCTKSCWYPCCSSC